MKMQPGRSRSGSRILVGAGSSSSGSAGRRKRGVRGRARGSGGSWDRWSGVLLIVRLGGETEGRYGFIMSLRLQMAREKGANHLKKSTRFYLTLRPLLVCFNLHSIKETKGWVTGD